MRIALLLNVELKCSTILCGIMRFVIVRCMMPHIAKKNDFGFEEGDKWARYPWFSLAFIPEMTKWTEVFPQLTFFKGSRMPDHVTEFIKLENTASRWKSSCWYMRRLLETSVWWCMAYGGHGHGVWNETFIQHFLIYVNNFRHCKIITDINKLNHRYQ